MKKILIHFLLILSFLTAFASVTFAQQQPISVIVNGTKITFPDAQPFIDSNDRTQTPARFIGEALGATVVWNGQERKATFTKGKDTLVLFIGEKNYLVNGNVKQMDTTALLKEDRTYVPARYVAEAFGATVTWDSANRIVNVTANDTDSKDDNSTESQQPTKINLSYKSETNRFYFILKDTKLGIYSAGKNYSEVYDTKNNRYTLTLPASLGVNITEEVLNINNTLVSSAQISKDKKTNDTNIVFNLKTDARFYISYNQESKQSELDVIKPVKVQYTYYNKFDRVYFALKNIKLANVSSTITNYFTESYDKINNKYTITIPSSAKICLVNEIINVNDSRVSNVEITTDANTNATHIVFNTKKEFKFYISYNDKLKQSEINLLTPATSSEKLVVIDAGHGGVDPGACVGTSYEKDFNLAIALKLEKLLEAKNIKTFMLRQDDTFVGLYDRPYIANALNASLFLSIHNNSIDNTSVSGTETLYYPEKAGDTSFTGQKFATLVQNSLISKIQTVNRKTVSRPNLVVLKYTKMPAALAEIGFLTNPTDLKNLKSESFQQKTAEALCDAIVKALAQK